MPLFADYFKGVTNFNSIKISKIELKSCCENIVHFGKNNKEFQLIATYVCSNLFSNKNIKEIILEKAKEDSYDWQ